MSLELVLTDWLCTHDGSLIKILLSTRRSWRRHSAGPIRQGAPVAAQGRSLGFVHVAHPEFEPGNGTSGSGLHLAVQNRSGWQEHPGLRWRLACTPQSPGGRGQAPYRPSQICPQVNSIRGRAAAADIGAPIFVGGLSASPHFRRFIVAFPSLRIGGISAVYKLHVAFSFMVCPGPQKGPCLKHVCMP